jgi:hypothetical protein
MPSVTLSAAQCRHLPSPGRASLAIARELGVTTTTLYVYVNGDGSPKAAAEAILQRSARPY